MVPAYTIEFLPPNSAIYDYILMSQPDDQLDTIPATFKDAMRVRNEVFGKEQGVPMEYEWDPYDARSTHWVMYSDTDSKRIPVATIRAAPFPHPPHPENGARYEELEDDAGPPPMPSRKPHPYIFDRATTLHDGREPYIKLGRMCVLKDFRGQGLATNLTMSALQWLRENPEFFNASNPEDLNPEVRHLRIWKGLVCVHAQEAVSPAWAKWGFEIDADMGKWYEARIPHVGMFQRLLLIAEN